MKEKLLISSCLCGNNTKYNGGNNLISRLKELEESFELFMVCPESQGGLTTPRDPSEIVGDKVVSNKGKDVTEEFNKGAIIALEEARKNGIKYALLKEGSPSCGSNLIYDGSFSGVKIPGLGVAARLLTEAGIKVYNENQIDELLNEIN